MIGDLKFVALLIASLPVVVQAQSLVPFPFSLDGAIDPLSKEIHSAFGPRDPCSPSGCNPDPEKIGSRFHQGIDLSPDNLGQVIRATPSGSGTITQISKRRDHGGNALYIDDPQGEFGYLHIFKNSTDPCVELEGNGLFLCTHRIAFPPDVTGPTYDCGDVVYDRPQNSNKRIVFVAKSIVAKDPCPGIQQLKGPNGDYYNVRRRVDSGQRFASKGNSGTVKPHLHLNYRTANGLKKNPLFRIEHDSPNYTASFLSAPRDSTPLSNPIFITTTDLPKGAWVTVNFSKGYDLDEVVFAIEGSGDPASGGRYTFAGTPAANTVVPSGINSNVCNGGKYSASCRIYRGAEAPPMAQQAIYAPEAGIGNKQLAFWVQLPSNLTAGSYKLQVRMLSVNGVMTARLPFSVVILGLDSPCSSRVVVPVTQPRQTSITMCPDASLNQSTDTPESQFLYYIYPPIWWQGQGRMPDSCASIGASPDLSGVPFSPMDVLTLSNGVSLGQRPEPMSFQGSSGPNHVTYTVSVVGSVLSEEWRLQQVLIDDRVNFKFQRNINGTITSIYDIGTRKQEYRVSYSGFQTYDWSNVPANGPLAGCTQSGKTFTFSGSKIHQY